MRALHIDGQNITTGVKWSRNGEATHAGIHYPPGNPAIVTLPDPVPEPYVDPHAEEVAALSGQLRGMLGSLDLQSVADLGALDDALLGMFQSGDPEAERTAIVMTNRIQTVTSRLRARGVDPESITVEET